MGRSRKGSLCCGTSAQFPFSQGLRSDPVFSAERKRVLAAPGYRLWSRLPDASFVYIQLSENVGHGRDQFSDFNLKLKALARRLPSCAKFLFAVKLSSDSLNVGSSRSCSAYAFPYSRACCLSP